MPLVTKSSLFIVLYACILTYFKSTTGSTSRSVVYGDESNKKCENLEISFCEDVLPYNETFFPNLLFQNSQEEAKTALLEFSPLINRNCSDSLKQFLCFIYAPPCTDTAGPVPVCKSLCEKVFTEDCRSIMTKWSVDSIVLDCERYPTSGLCITPDQVSSGSGRDGVGGKGVMPLNPFIKGPDSLYSESGSAETVDPTIKLDLFLLVTSGAEIQLLNIKGPNDMDTITIHRRVESENNLAIDLFLPKKYIYWASTGDAKIVRGTLENDQMYNIRNLIDTGTATVTSLAVDWNLKVLFWSEIFTVPSPRIRTSSLSGRGVTTVIDRDLIHPIGLTLDPSEGKIFWIDKRGSLRQPHALIESYSIVTQKRTLILNITSSSVKGGGRPCALITDIEEKRLYWVDSRSQSLHSMNYDGSDPEVLLQDNERLNDPENLIIKGDYLLWMDRHFLMRVNKRNASDELLIKVFERNPPQSLRLYEERSAEDSNYDRESLTKTWRDLSSSESMEDKPNYDAEDYYYDDNDTTRKNSKNKSNKDSGVCRICTDIYLLVIIGLSILRNLF